MCEAPCAATRRGAPLRVMSGADATADGDTPATSHVGVSENCCGTGGRCGGACEQNTPERGMPHSAQPSSGFSTYARRCAPDAGELEWCSEPEADAFVALTSPPGTQAVDPAAASQQCTPVASPARDLGVQAGPPPCLTDAEPFADVLVSLQREVELQRQDLCRLTAGSSASPGASRLIESGLEHEIASLREEVAEKSAEIDAVRGEAERLCDAVDAKNAQLRLRGEVQEARQACLESLLEARQADAEASAQQVVELRRRCAELGRSESALEAHVSALREELESERCSHSIAMATLEGSTQGSCTLRGEAGPARECGMRQQLDGELMRRGQHAAHGLEFRALLPCNALGGVEEADGGAAPYVHATPEAQHGDPRTQTEEMRALPVEQHALSQVEQHSYAAALQQAEARMTSLLESREATEAEYHQTRDEMRRQHRALELETDELRASVAVECVAHHREHMASARHVQGLSEQLAEQEANARAAAREASQFRLHAEETIAELRRSDQASRGEALFVHAERKELETCSSAVNPTLSEPAVSTTSKRHCQDADAILRPLSAKKSLAFRHPKARVQDATPVGAESSTSCGGSSARPRPYGGRASRATSGGSSSDGGEEAVGQSLHDEVEARGRAAQVIQQRFRSTVRRRRREEAAAIGRLPAIVGRRGRRGAPAAAEGGFDPPMAEARDRRKRGAWGQFSGSPRSADPAFLEDSISAELPAKSLWRRDKRVRAPRSGSASEDMAPPSGRSKRSSRRGRPRLPPAPLDELDHVAIIAPAAQCLASQVGHVSLDQALALAVADPEQAVHRAAGAPRRLSSSSSERVGAGRIDPSGETSKTSPRVHAQPVAPDPPGASSGCRRKRWHLPEVPCMALTQTPRETQRPAAPGTPIE